MAKSGSFSKTFAAGYTLKVAWEELNVDVANNQSDVKCTVTLSATGNYHISSSASKDIMLTINGTKYTGTCTVGISAGGSKTLMTKTLSNINHGSDGSKSVSISCTLGIAVTLGGSYISSVSTSGTATLTKIVRASSLSASNGTIGTEQTLAVTRQSSSFTHTISYSCGDTSGTIVSKSSSTRIAWTPPLSLAQQNTTGTSVSVKITITTYNGDSKVGSSATKTINCSIPSSVKPTVSISVSDPNGYASTYGGYVKGKSKIKVAITASGSQGSTIKSYSTSANGKTYTGSSVTTEVVASSGTITIKTTATDSRGRATSVSKNITAIAYSNPKISSLKAYRSDSSGTANSSEKYLTVQFTAAITSLNSKNSAAYTLKYKKNSESSYTSVTLSSYSGDYNPSSAKYTFSADISSSYDIVLTAKDAFTSVSKSISGASTSKLFSILAGLNGWAFGKVAELGGYIDVAFKTMFRDHVYFKTNYRIYGTATDGSSREALDPQNNNGDTVLGYGNYEAQYGNTNIYGYDILFGVANIATPGTYKPYIRQGDSFNVDVFTSGYVTNSGHDVYFTIPLTRPICGQPTVSVSSIDGFRLRQDKAYTHGCTSSTFAKPSTMTADGQYSMGVVVKASFTNTTNVVNNAPIGIDFYGTLTFS